MICFVTQVTEALTSVRERNERLKREQQAATSQQQAEALTTIAMARDRLNKLSERAEGLDCDDEAFDTVHDAATKAVIAAEMYRDMTKSGYAAHTWQRVELCTVSPIGVTLRIVQRNRRNRRAAGEPVRRGEVRCCGAGCRTTTAAGSAQRSAASKGGGSRGCCDDVIGKSARKAGLDAAELAW